MSLLLDFLDFFLEFLVGFSSCLFERLLLVGQALLFRFDGFVLTQVLVQGLLIFLRGQGTLPQLGRGLRQQHPVDVAEAAAHAAVKRSSASEYSRQCIVFAGGDGIELVVVAAGATESQSLKGPAQGIELVVHDIHAEFLFVGVHDRPGSDGQEARGHDLLTALVVGLPGEDVSRNLLLNEAIVGLVGIERIDDVVAISPGLPCGDAATLAQIVGIARQIEPVPSPALAESGRFRRSRSTTFSKASSESSLTNDSISDGFGGRPMRSK